MVTESHSNKKRRSSYSFHGQVKYDSTILPFPRLKIQMAYYLTLPVLSSTEYHAASRTYR